jgi:hypothetical protein
MTKSSPSESHRRRSEHAVAVASTAAAQAAATRIAVEARSEEELEEEAFVARIVEDPDLLRRARRAASASLSDTGFDDVELKVVEFEGKGREDFGVVVRVAGDERPYPVNHKREGAGTSHRRVARRGAMVHNTVGLAPTPGRALSEYLVRDFVTSGHPLGWGVVALIGKLGEVRVQSYDVPAVLATTESFNGLGGAVTVPGFVAAPFGATCAMYGAEDCVLQASHSLAHSQWWTLVSKLGRSRVSRRELTTAALERYVRARKVWLTAAAAENDAVLDAIVELRELDAAGLLAR